MYCRYLIFSLRFPVLFDAKIFCLLVNSFKEVEGLMVNLNKVAPVLTVVVLLLTVQYSSEPYDSWDAVLAIAAVIVFWTTCKEWRKV